MSQTFNVLLLIPDGRLTVDEADTLAMMRGRHMEEVWPTAPPTRLTIDATKEHHCMVLLETGHGVEEVAEMLRLRVTQVERVAKRRREWLREMGRRDGLGAGRRVA